MNFTSLEFLIFFPVVLLLYWLLPGRMRWPLLLCTSYLFYMNWNPWLALLLLGTTLVSYLAGWGIAHTNSATRRRMWLVLGAAVPLGCLGLFKYADFFLAASGALLAQFGWTVNTPQLELLLPVGISFYTFQTLSYVLDIYGGRIEPEPHFGYYALYVSFFPQLVAGPIERPEHLLPQLKEEHRLSGADVRQGLWLMLRGYFKKLVLADTLALLADPVFAASDAASGPAVLLGTVCFALQIYCDFSGYSDIASGTARWMGIRLMRNFDRPYRAETIGDFWRRWHISLTGWFSDYLYKPLGGSRAGLRRQIRNVLIVFLVSGLWHGADWTFVVWGGIHGLYRAAGLLYRRLRRKGKTPAVQPVRRLLRRVRTFGLVCFAWLFFRADSMGEAVQLLERFFTCWGRGSVSAALSMMHLDGLLAGELLLALACLLLLERIPEELPPASTVPMAARRCLQGFLLVLTILFSWLLLLSGTGESAFLYFQF